METIKEKILKERAETLAKTPATLHAKEKALEKVVVFSLANEHYALEVKWIREVFIVKEVTKLPSVPSYVFGLINVRSQIYSIVDLRELFELEKNHNFGQVIILENKDLSFGIFTEEILGVKTIDLKELQSPLLSMNGVHQEFLKGINEERLVVLDGEKLLSSTALIVNETV